MSEAKEIRIGGNSGKKDSWSISSADQQNSGQDTQQTNTVIRTSNPQSQPTSINLGATSSSNEQPGISSPEPQQVVSEPQQQVQQNNQPRYNRNDTSRPVIPTDVGTSGQQQNTQQAQQYRGNNNQNNGQQQNRQQNNNQQNGGNRNNNQNNGKKDVAPALVKTDPNHYFGYAENDTSIGYQPADNKFGLKPVGALFRLTEDNIADWFQDYFDHYGYTGIQFGFGDSKFEEENRMAIPKMFLLIPRHGNIIKGGKKDNDNMSGDEIASALLGYKNNGGRVRLDETFRHLVKRFLWFRDINDKKGRYILKDQIRLSKENPRFGYLEINPMELIRYNFCDNSSYEVNIPACNFLDADRRSDVFIVVERIKKARNPKDSELFRAMQCGRRMY